MRSVNSSVAAECASLPSIAVNSSPKMGTVMTSIGLRGLSIYCLFDGIKGQSSMASLAIRQQLLGISCNGSEKGLRAVRTLPLPGPIEVDETFAAENVTSTPLRSAMPDAAPLVRLR